METNQDTTIVNAPSGASKIREMISLLVVGVLLSITLGGLLGLLSPHMRFYSGIDVALALFALCLGPVVLMATGTVFAGLVARATRYVHEPSDRRAALKTGLLLGFVFILFLFIAEAIAESAALINLVSQNAVHSFGLAFSAPAWTCWLIAPLILGSFLAYKGITAFQAEEAACRVRSEQAEREEAERLRQVAEREAEAQRQRDAATEEQERRVQEQRRREQMQAELDRLKQLREEADASSTENTQHQEARVVAIHYLHASENQKALEAKAEALRREAAELMVPIPLDPESKEKLDTLRVLIDSKVKAAFSALQSRIDPIWTPGGSNHTAEHAGVRLGL